MSVSFPRTILVALVVVLALLGAACESAGPSDSGDAGRVDAVDAPADARTADVGRPDVSADAASDVATDVEADAAGPEDVWHGPWTCPADMALAETDALVVCVDRYEASRPDATWYEAGTDESRATSRAEVLPWVLGDDRPAAEAACVAAGKRLCGAREWQAACGGPDGLAYPYGDIYRDDVCNGFEAHGPGGFKLLPTGRMPRCESPFGVFDMSGNVWELVADDTELVPRGGAYDSTDGNYTHRCSYVREGGRVSAVGFRCCVDPSPDTE